MNTDWEIEVKRLNEAEKVIAAELLRKMGKGEDYKRDMRTINKEMWEDVGVLSGHSTFDITAQFMQEINFLKRNMADTAINYKEIKKLEQQVQSPYFGRIDFREEDSEKESFYIGTYGLRKRDTGEFLIYDWRAPISSMFYDYETGPAQYECPAGYIKGDLLLKRQYRIEKGKLALMFDSSIAIEDQILQDILAGSADNRMKTIVSTIQKEQNRAIRSEDKRVLAVQGSAGSGKTSIALHRAAYLLYRHRGNINADNICLYTPNGIFAKYISSILPELGEDDIPCRTLTGLAQSILKDKFGIFESYADMMEWQLSRRNSKEYVKRIEDIRFKASKTFAEMLEEFVIEFENKIISFETLSFDDTVFAAKEELTELFLKSFADMPIDKRLKRMELIINPRIREFEKKIEQKKLLELSIEGEFIDEGEIKAKSHLLAAVELEGVRSKLRKMLSIDISALYSELLKNIEVAGNAAGNRVYQNEIKQNESPQNEFNQNGQNVLKYENQAPVLYLMSLLGMIDQDKEVKHVIIDEAQDYSYVAYKLFSRLYPSCGITLLGDISQNINPVSGIGNLQRAGEIIDSANLEFLELDKSYRSTVEIMEFASRILDNKAMPFGRHGKTPEILKASSQQDIYKLAEECAINARKEGLGSIAVICRTLSDCSKVHSHLKNLPANLVQNGDEEIPSGIVVIPSYLAKGLEFDAVIPAVLSENDYSADESQLFYTVCTRALHRLNICTVGNSGILHFLEL